MTEPEQRIEQDHPALLRPLSLNALEDLAPAGLEDLLICRALVFGQVAIRDLLDLLWEVGCHLSLHSPEEEWADTPR